MRTFWDAVSGFDPWNKKGLPDAVCKACSAGAVASTMVFGQPGMFAPRMTLPSSFFLCGSAGQTSYYDTSPLHDTLLQLVDFDCLSRHEVRLSLGAVHVRTGRTRYFDSLFQRIGPEHILASGALSPGFPAVAVDGEPYWDGRIVSSTPLEVVLDDAPRVNTLCIMVDLFDPVGPEPASMADVHARHNDITYANRSERGIREFEEKHNLRRAIRALYKALPEQKRRDPELH